MFVFLISFGNQSPALAVSLEHPCQPTPCGKRLPRAVETGWLTDAILKPSCHRSLLCVFISVSSSSPISAVGSSRIPILSSPHFLLRAIRLFPHPSNCFVFPPALSFSRLMTPCPNTSLQIIEPSRPTSTGAVSFS